MIYFDNAATTPTDHNVINEMLKYLKSIYGNPSSNHYTGRICKDGIENARIIIAKTINALPEEIIFTSGGTEADNMAINIVKNNDKKHIITSKIEHPAVLNKIKELEKNGYYATYIDVDNSGTVDINILCKSINKNTGIISVMYANNEIGTIEPIKEIAEIARDNNIIFHTDAVQAYGHLDIDVKKQKIDMLSVSAHKFFGPKGVGFLYCNKSLNISPIIYGGGQERGLRSGTENVPAIIGMAIACKNAYRNLNNNHSYLSKLQKYFISRIRFEIPDSYINGSLTNRLPGNINVSFKGVNALELLSILDINGICASAGSACQNNKNKTSHVLKAIGLEDEMIASSIRFSLSINNSVDEINKCIFILKKSIEELRNVNNS